MSFYMQKDGWKTIAGILAGSCNKIDGMYAEFSTGPLEAGERSHDKYMLDNSIKYVRIPVATASVDKDGSVVYTGYLSAENMPKDIPTDAVIRCITLVSMDKNSPADDILVGTVSLKAPVKLVDNTYIVLHAGMKIGDSK